MTFPPPPPLAHCMATLTPPTAAILIIGNEILSGKTKDANTPWIAAQLKGRGIKVCEVRVVADTQHAMSRLSTPCAKDTILFFTTGGICPRTMTSPRKAFLAAFGLAHVIHPDAHARMAMITPRAELNSTHRACAWQPCPKVRNCCNQARAARPVSRWHKSSAWPVFPM